MTLWGHYEMGVTLRYKSCSEAQRRNPVPGRVQWCMRRTAWIWLLGCVAWAVDGAVNVLKREPQHAELAFLMALLFGIAWLFYRGMRR